MIFFSFPLSSCLLVLMWSELLFIWFSACMQYLFLPPLWVDFKILSFSSFFNSLFMTFSSIIFLGGGVWGSLRFFLLIFNVTFEICGSAFHQIIFLPSFSFSSPSKTPIIHILGCLVFHRSLNFCSLFFSFASIFQIKYFYWFLWKLSDPSNLQFVAEPIPWVFYFILVFRKKLFL